MIQSCQTFEDQLDQIVKKSMLMTLKNQKIVDESDIGIKLLEAGYSVKELKENYDYVIKCWKLNEI